MSYAIRGAAKTKSHKKGKSPEQAPLALGSSSAAPVLAASGTYSEQTPWPPRAVAARLSVLLEQATIDLGEISTAIRMCPEFEQLVLHTSDSPGFSLGIPTPGIEDAVVVLGKNRLKILLGIWLSGHTLESAEENEVISEIPSGKKV